MRKRDQSIYLPGLISLILIPLFSIGYFYFSGKFEKHRAIQINYYDPGNPFWAPIPVRNYQKVVITRDVEDTRAKIYFIKNKISEIIKINDTINGIQVQFSKDAKYDHFVQCINMLRVEGVRYYIAEKNNLWILHKFDNSEGEEIKPIYM